MRSKTHVRPRTHDFTTCSVEHKENLEELFGHLESKIFADSLFEQQLKGPEPH